MSAEKPSNRTLDDWSKRELGEVTSLVLGWRYSRRLKAGRLDLSQEMADAMREHASVLLERVAELEPRVWEPTAQLEEDEAFLMTSDELPASVGPEVAEEGPSTVTEIEAGASALIDLVSDPGSLDKLPAEQARGSVFLLYACVFQSSYGSNPIAFVKRHNPARVAKRGFLTGTLGNTLKKLEQPILIFEQDFDLVIDGDHILALRDDAVQRLFVDIEVLAAAVPTYVSQLAGSKLRLSNDVQATIKAACGGRRLLARRLQQLVAQQHLAALTPRRVEDYLDKQGMDPARFVRDGRVVLEPGDVAEFLDVLDQRHYRGGYDDQLRRADRSSLMRRPNQPTR